jgi:hypothetical protein
MFDVDLVSAVRKKAALDLDDRKEAFAREVANIRERMNINGALRSSMTQRQIIDAIGNEFRIRCFLIWDTFSRGLSSKESGFDDSSADEIKRELAALVDEHSNDLLAAHIEMQKLMRGSSGLKSVEQLRGDAFSRVNAEIDLAVLGQIKRKNVGGGNINIYQGFGIVQTGVASSASLTVTVNVEERREIGVALEALESVIETSLGVDDDRRKDALELVGDLRTEMDRPKPNRSRIRGAILGLATTIQTIAAAPQVYNLLKGAAALFGLRLP